MLPKRLPTGTRYLSASAFSNYVTFVEPNAGQAADGTPLAETVVASGVHAAVMLWRGKERDQQQTRTGTTSYKIVIRYPKTYSVNGGMNILVRNQRHNIESIADPDGQQVELHLQTWVENDAVVNS